MDAHARDCEVMVFSGSLPPDAPPEIFADLIRIAKSHGAKCLLDTAGPALKQGLAAGPSLIKPNRAEVEDLLGKTFPSHAELVESARTLMRMGSQRVLISLGAEGAVGVAGKDALFARRPLSRCEAAWGRATPWWRPWLTPPSRACPFAKPSAWP